MPVDKAVDKYCNPSN